MHRLYTNSLSVYTNSSLCPSSDVAFVQGSFTKGDRVSLAGCESHAKYIRGVVQGKYACRKASRRSKFRGQGATTQVVRTGASLISISL